VASINKADLVRGVAESANVSQSEAERVLDSFFGTVVSAAKAGNEVAWPGFGKFSASSRAARTGRNPATGATIKIAASKGLKFSASSVLKNELNAKKAATKSAPAKKKAPAKKAAAKKR
jgi:DNA-binding protein HU-beta